MFRDRPFSPVIGKKRNSKGTQWYEHEDGSFSTTIMGYRKDLGRMDAITNVAHPAETKPLLLDEVVGPGGINPPKKNAKGPGSQAAPKSGKTGGKKTGNNK